MSLKKMLCGFGSAKSADTTQGETGMKRLADLPLIVKMGFAPLLAVIALAAVTGVGFVAQKQQSAVLERVVNRDMSTSLRFAALEQKIASDHGEMYVLIARQAGNVDTAKIAPRIKELVADVDGMTKELQALSKVQVQ